MKRTNIVKVKIFNNYNKCEFIFPSNHQMATNPNGNGKLITTNDKRKLKKKNKKKHKLWEIL